MKYLLVVGYINIKGVTTMPILMHSQLSENKTPKSTTAKAASSREAWVKLISPEARGLYFVLSTCLSISLSIMSLITQPADLVANAPRVKRAVIPSGGRKPVLPSVRPQ